MAVISAQSEDGQLHVLTVLPDRKKATVVAWLKTIPAAIRSRITTVCTDMWEGYITAVQEVLPDATIVIDRFHVARHYRDGVDELRKHPRDGQCYAADPDDLAMLLFTSGSTSAAKAVMQSHRNLLNQAAGMSQWHEFDATDVSFNWMPLDHVGGIIMLHLHDAFVGLRQVHAPGELVLKDPLAWLVTATAGATLSSVNVTDTGAD